MKNYSEEEKNILRKHYYDYLRNINISNHSGSLPILKFEFFAKQNYNKLIRFNKINKILNVQER